MLWICIVRNYHQGFVVVGMVMFHGGDAVCAEAPTLKVVACDTQHMRKHPSRLTSVRSAAAHQSLKCSDCAVQASDEPDNSEPDQPGDPNNEDRGVKYASVLHGNPEGRGRTRAAKAGMPATVV